MARVILVRQLSGSPDLLTLEAWQALSRGPVFAAPTEPLADRLREVDVSVTTLESAAQDALRSHAQTARTPSVKPALRLLAHMHETTLPGAAALADELARLAVERDEVVFVLPVDSAEAVTKAVFERALAGDIEVEVVIGRAPPGHRLLDVVRVMARLRAPGGCPWDAEQTHTSLAKYLLDETYELLEAIETRDAHHMAEELGDLLLQVAFHAEIGAAEGAFTIDDVAERLATKLVARHPHVFGDVDVEGASEVVANWEVIKDHEKGRTSVLEGVPEALPALAYAQKILKRAARGSLQPGSVGAPPVSEEALGDALLAAVAAARSAGFDAEAALRRSARRFRDRLARVEDLARARGKSFADLSESEAVELWEQA